MFSNPRSIARKPLDMQFTLHPSQRSNYNPVIRNNISGIPRVAIPAPAPAPAKATSKVLKWGPPFWFLFHTLAEKVNESKFAIMRVELLNLIFLICQNLPCPDCTNHATQYLNSINFKGIQTKQQLKETLFVFHNSVNARKGNPIFSQAELDSKYEKANLHAIWRNFIIEFSRKQKNMRMLSNDFHRENITKVLQTWFASNASNFD
jgi:hypothetical protein